MSKSNINKDLFLEVDVDGDGVIELIWGQVKGDLQKFGSILTDSAKLISSDIGILVKLTFGRLKSIEDIQRMMKEQNSKRKGYLKSISSNSNALMDSWPDGRITSMMVAPGFFFTTSTLNGLGTITSDEFKASLKDAGIDSIPLSSLFLGNTGSKRRSFYDDISRCDPGDGECYSRALSIPPPSETERGTLTNLALKINSIFLFAHHNTPGNIIEEGEEDTTASEIEIPKGHETELLSWMSKKIDEGLKEERVSWIEGQKTYFDKLIEEASNVIALNSKLASAVESKVFFKQLESLKSLADDNLKDMDIEKIKTGFSEMGKKFKEDEESMKKLEEEFEKEKIEKTQEAVDKRLEKIVLNSFKSQFLQELKSSLTDYYESVYTSLTGGVSDDQKKLLLNSLLGKEYFKMIDSYENKLKDALSNLK